ncbi:Bax inhibitor-1 family protein [Collinsella sp. AGMB00827]|uniref:Bax inhibitor-1 family protein n=1 Tax=Collinsella ureilytica TaxID=2869515 RepID=A0ABS7MI98_9ACTN|nr:Bax inhibitor-1 family protein [Collinsella urealyticum]MBY4797096.1 Bax inhibitor-1 family protein [Collinsella urealyticum]
MSNESLNIRDERTISPFDPTLDHSTRISRRQYNLIMGGLVTLGFAVIAAAAFLVMTPAFFFMVYENYGLVLLASVVVSIGGVFVLARGMRREGFGQALVGYGMIVGSIGFTTGMILPLYDLPSIANAFVGTAIIATLFTLLGSVYPQVFAKIRGVLSVALLGAIVVGLVGSFMNVSMAWLDYVVIAVFCGLIGYDTYRAQQCESTVKMAIFNAAQIWLDLVNIFIRLLAIVGRRR